jgi:histidine triad (HIT) family protein
LNRGLLAAAKSPATRQIIGWVFANMSFALPVNRLRETEWLIAFHHPRPSYPIHILLVPKKAIASLAELGSDDAEFLTNLFTTIQDLVAELNMEEPGYRLIANGGDYQEVPQLHFHLVSGSA